MADCRARTWSRAPAPQDDRGRRTSTVENCCRTGATKRRSRAAERDLDLCRHYGTESTCNNPGVANENGSLQAANGHLKIRLDQRLRRRGSRDFDSLEARNSTINVDRILYSVPSRLIGNKIEVRLFCDRLECFLGPDSVMRMTHVRTDRARGHLIDSIM